MKNIFLLVAVVFLCSACQQNKLYRQNKSALQAAQTIKTYKAIGDLNDAYFDIKQNNYFEFYMQLFDSVKNTYYPGTYNQNGDTLHLQFFNKKGAAFLGTKALINSSKNEIIFFDKKVSLLKKTAFN